MQSFQVLLNRGYSATTQEQQAKDISSFGDYYVYSETVGGGLVDQFTVRSFMNEGKNQFIVQDFIAYLTGSTTESEIVQILGSDQMLSDIFNEYYQTSTLSGQQTTNAIINTNLVDTITISIVDHDFNWNGVAIDNVLDNIPKGIDQATRINEFYNKNIKITSEESYYVPINIKRNYDETARMKYDLCEDVISLIVEPHLSDLDIAELEEKLVIINDQDAGITEGLLPKRFPPDPPPEFSEKFFTTYAALWLSMCQAAVTNQTEHTLCQRLAQAISALTAAYPIDPSYVESFFPAPFTFESTLVGLVNYLISRGINVTLSSYDFINGQSFGFGADAPINSSDMIGEIGVRTPEINYVYPQPSNAPSSRGASRAAPGTGSGFLINQGSLDPVDGKGGKGGKTK